MPINKIDNIGVQGPSVIPTIDAPVIQQTPPPVSRGLALPVFRMPDPSIKYPVINVPTQEEFDAAVNAEKQKEQQQQQEEKTRVLPDSKPILPQIPVQNIQDNRIISDDAPKTNLGVPVIEVPIVGEVPVPPKEQVILAGTTATASVAAALIGKSLVEWMVGKMKPIIQQILIRGKKLLNRDLTQYELQLYFTAELDKKNLKLLKKEWKEEKKSQYKKAHDK